MSHLQGSRSRCSAKAWRQTFSCAQEAVHNSLEVLQLLRRLIPQIIRQVVQASLKRHLPSICRPTASQGSLIPRPVTIGSPSAESSFSPLSASLFIVPIRLRLECPSPPPFQTSAVGSIA